MGFRLGVDLGTTFTAAAVDDGSGPAMLGLGNRALTVPSVAFLTDDGSFLFGEAAERRATSEPARSAREFKRRIGDTVPLLLAGQPFSAQSLSAKMLSWVVSVASERQGAAPDEVVVTYPANWGGYKRELLDQLVNLADLPGSLTCTEPEAAATQYAARARLEPGDKVAVYDLGGGTFDACVLEKQETDFRIIGSPDGVEHLGGIDFDEAVFQHVLELLGDRMADLDPDDPEVTQGVARLRRECVEAKEALSSDVETTVPVALPGLNTSLRITRAELERLLTGPLRDTLDATRRALRSAGVEASDLATVVLVGGSSRIPLVSHLLQSEFGVRTAMDTHPKHDIALGAVRYHALASGEAAPPAAPTVAQWPTRGKQEDAPPPPPPPQATVPIAASTPGPAAPSSDGPKPPGPPEWRPSEGSAGGPAQPGGRGLRNRRVLVGAAAAVALLLAGGATAYALTQGGDEGGGDTARESDPAEPDTATDSPSPQRVFDEDTILASVSDGPDENAQLLQLNAAGEDLGPIVSGPGSFDAPWFSRDGTVVGYRQSPAATEQDQGRIMVMTADGTSSAFIEGETPGVDCRLRVFWDPTQPRVVLNCIEDVDGDGKNETSLWEAPLTDDIHIDGTQLTPLLNNDDATQDSPEGSPNSQFRGVSFLPNGDVTLNYYRGQESGLHVLPPDGVPRRLTSGVEDTPAASPAAQLVAFVRDGDLYVVSADGGRPPCPAPRTRSQDEVTGAELCNLTGDRTSPDDVVASEPAWSWDGRTIVYALLDADGRGTLEQVSLGQADDRPPIIGTPAYITGPAWGPR